MLLQYSDFYFKLQVVITLVRDSCGQGLDISSVCQFLRVLHQVITISDCLSPCRSTAVRLTRRGSQRKVMSATASPPSFGFVFDFLSLACLTSQSKEEDS